MSQNNFVRRGLTRNRYEKLCHEDIGSAGFQVEDALSFILKHYCRSSNEERNRFYPALDEHPFAGGYEAYARAAYVHHTHL